MTKKEQRQKMLQAYSTAYRLMSQIDPKTKRNYTQIRACEIAGITRMTFNKYREEFGDPIKGTSHLFEVAPVEKTTAKSTPAAKSGLEKMIEENAIMAENLRLKQQLGLIQ